MTMVDKVKNYRYVTLIMRGERDWPGDKEMERLLRDSATVAEARQHYALEEDALEEEDAARPSIS